ncbi:MAG: ATP-binding protein [Chloroflexota bacterium]|nr:ATP-binding protein [Chloroflexota bacterium]
MITRDELRQIELFAHLRDDQCDWIISHSEQIQVEAGEYIFRQDAPADYWYMVISGDVQIVQVRDNAEYILATHGTGNFSGEVPLLSGAPYLASMRALVPSVLLRLDGQNFRDMFGVCPVIVSKLFNALQWRIQTTEALARQREKLSSLGVLAAGLAHELNNPAAAAVRAANQLGMAMDALQAPLMRLAGTISADQIDGLLRVRADAVGHIMKPTEHAMMAQGDLEEDVGGWLDDQNIDNSWDIAPIFVKAEIDSTRLETLRHAIGDAALPDAIGWLCAALNAAELVREVEQSTKRISGLVKAVKSYSYMDQAPQQEVDLHEGLDDTLTIMAHKLRSDHIAVVKHYDKTLPQIQAYGSELNQVWTNLIDNAIDAMHSANGKGTLTLSTTQTETDVWIEIADDGPGMPDHVKEHIFEAFYTTKEVGKGTGLGLDIAHRIIFARHRGEIQVESAPGEGTRFRIRLPLA